MVKMSPQQENTGAGEGLEAPQRAGNHANHSATVTDYGSSSAVIPLQAEAGQAEQISELADQQKARGLLLLSQAEKAAARNTNGATNTNVQVPSFLVKTYDIVCDPASDDIIAWNKEGSAFTVKQVNKFSDSVLPKYFKHNNFSSFIR